MSKKFIRNDVRLSLDSVVISYDDVGEVKNRRYWSITPASKARLIRTMISLGAAATLLGYVLHFLRGLQ